MPSSSSAVASCPIPAVSFALCLAFVARARADTPSIEFGPTSSPASISSQLPASGPFIAKYTFGKLVTSATLDVWPEQYGPCDGPAAQGVKQSYKLPVSIATESGKSVGTAQVPHLQLNEKFCFRFEWEELGTPDPALLLTVAREQIQNPATTQPEAEAFAEALVTRASAGFCEPPATASVGQFECAPISKAELARQLLAAGLPVVVLKSSVEQLQQTLATKESAIRALAGDAKKQAEQLVSNIRTEKLAVEGRLATAIDEAVRGQVTLASEFLKTRLVATKTEPKSVSATTSDFHNYFSPELGVSLATPFVKGATVSLIPYAAVNIYFRPVERMLPMDQLLHPGWQRFSLSIGLALAQTLSAKHVDFSNTVAGTYGLIGAGVRVLPFARVAALLMFTRARPSGELSGDAKLVTAGALAISADLDAVAFISSQLNK